MKITESKIRNTIRKVLLESRLDANRLIGQLQDEVARGYLQPNKEAITRRAIAAVEEDGVDPIWIDTIVDGVLMFALSMR